MTLTEAMDIIEAHPAGPDAVAVWRPDDRRTALFYFACPPLPDGRVPLMSGWVHQGRDSETFSAIFYADDIRSTDWEVLDFK